MKMDPRLMELIKAYQARVLDAVHCLERAGSGRPASNTEWVGMAVPRGELVPGYQFHKHGFGCAVRGPDWSVDFDFGDHGEIDGFDLSRLKAFAAQRIDRYGFETEEMLVA